MYEPDWTREYPPKRRKKSSKPKNKPLTPKRSFGLIEEFERKQAREQELESQRNPEPRKIRCSDEDGRVYYLTQQEWDALSEE